MEISNYRHKSTNFYLQPETRNGSVEYELARKIILSAANLKMDAYQVRKSFDICQKLYNNAADMLLVDASDAEKVFDFGV